MGLHEEHERLRFTVMLFALDGWFGQQRLHDVGQLLKTVMLRQDNVEFPRGDQLRSKLVAERREADNLHMGQLSAQD